MISIFAANSVRPRADPIGSAEDAITIDEGSQRCIAVRLYFLMAQAEGHRLNDRRMTCSDLTQTLVDHPEQIDMDACGYDVSAGDVQLVKAISETILQSSISATPRPCDGRC